MNELTLQETINWLKYIAESPDKKRGGFHKTTIMIAKSALKHLENRYSIAIVIKILYKRDVDRFINEIERAHKSAAKSKLKFD